MHYKKLQKIYNKKIYFKINLIKSHRYILSSIYVLKILYSKWYEHQETEVVGVYFFRIKILVIFDVLRSLIH